jgi:choice-of-anchor A domain-containing protein
MEDFIIGELITNNNTIFSLVVGGNATIVSGQVQPASASLFVAEDFSVPSNFTNQVVSISTPHVLDTAFQDAFLCYFQISILLSKISQNVIVHFTYSNLVISCPFDARIYSITLFPETLNMATQYQINSNCNPTSHWVINVPGTGNVNFTGTPFPPVAGGAVFNIFGSGRTIFVNSDVSASILAPSNFLVQTGGFIQGKVVVGDATSVKKVSLPICPKNF